MNIAVLSVGKLREKYYLDAASEYRKRLSRFGTFDSVEVPDLPEPANSSDALEKVLRDREAERLLREIRPGDYVIALCIEGKPSTSEALAERLSALEMQGRRIVFVIGGSLGLGEALTERADHKLSLSPMTFPHQLARVMLWEQLYRAMKIRAHERYHK